MVHFTGIRPSCSVGARVRVRHSADGPFHAKNNMFTGTFSLGHWCVCFPFVFFRSSVFSVCVSSECVCGHEHGLSTSASPGSIDLHNSQRFAFLSFCSSVLLVTSSFFWSSVGLALLVAQWMCAVLFRVVLVSSASCVDRSLCEWLLMGCFVDVIRLCVRVAFQCVVLK